MTSRISGCLTVLIGMALALPVSADENTGPYLGASLGYSLLEVAEDIEIDDVEAEFEIDDEDFAWKAFPGDQFLWGCRCSSEVARATAATRWSAARRPRPDGRLRCCRSRARRPHTVR